MSIRAMAAVWDLSLDPTDKLLLLALADYADASGVAWPAYPTLAARVGVSERQVRRIIARVEAAGHLSRVRGGKGPGDSTRYTLTAVRGTPASPSKGDMTGRKGDTHVRKRGTPMSLEPSRNPHIEPEGMISVTDALRRARSAIAPAVWNRADGTGVSGEGPGAPPRGGMAHVSHVRFAALGTGIPGHRGGTGSVAAVRGAENGNGRAY